MLEADVVVNLQKIFNSKPKTLKLKKKNEENKLKNENQNQHCPISTLKIQIKPRRQWGLARRWTTREREATSDIYYRIARSLIMPFNMQILDASFHQRILITSLNLLWNSLMCNVGSVRCFWKYNNVNHYKNNIYTNWQMEQRCRQLYTQRLIN